MFIQLLSFSGSCTARPTLINLNPNEFFKDYITIHLWLIYIDLMEVVILLMIHLIKYVLQTKRKM